LKYRSRGEKWARLSMMYQKLKGLVVLSKNVGRLYPIQIKRVSLKYGSRGEKRSAALHDVLETKGVIDESRKPRKNLCH
jgi:hypothetical protein